VSPPSLPPHADSKSAAVAAVARPDRNFFFMDSPVGVSLVPNYKGTRRRDDWTKKHAMDPPSIEFNNRVVLPRMEEVQPYFRDSDNTRPDRTPGHGITNSAGTRIYSRTQGEGSHIEAPPSHKQKRRRNGLSTPRSTASPLKTFNYCDLQPLSFRCEFNKVARTTPCETRVTVRVRVVTFIAHERVPR